MSKSDNLRYSIIPARAVTDPDVTAQALRVLALLGRHTEENGWCRRSQVKMAEELGCSRGTVQNALDLLIGPENGKGYVERREENRPGVRPKEGRHPHCSYSYRVRLDLDDLKAAGANRLAGGVPIPEQHGVPTLDQHGVPASLAPLTERTPCERPLGNDDARAGEIDWSVIGDCLIALCNVIAAGKKPKIKSPYSSGFADRVWPEFLKWPNRTNGTKWDAWKAYEQLAGVRPSDGDLVVAIRAEGRWMEQQNARRRANDPYPAPHPSTWLRRRGWEQRLEDMALAAASRDPDQMPRRITLAPEHVEALRNAGLSEAVVAEWFADGEYRALPEPTFLTSKPFKRNWIEQHFLAPLKRAFGVRDIAIIVKQDKAA